MNTEAQSIESRLMNMDYDIHNLMREVRVSNKSIKLGEVINEIKSNQKEDSDTTVAIKEMREKKYEI